MNVKIKAFKAVRNIKKSEVREVVEDLIESYEKDELSSVFVLEVLKDGCISIYHTEQDMAKINLALDIIKADLLESEMSEVERGPNLIEDE